MRAAILDRSPAHHAKPLVVRAGPARTFGSLVSFVAVLLLTLGLYLLNDALEHPIAAQAVAILAAAFSITIAATLLYYLVKPRPKKSQRDAFSVE